VSTIPLQCPSIEGQNYSQFTMLLGVGILLPARPLNVTLIAETYHRTMNTSDQTFGYDKFSEMRYYPLLEYTFDQWQSHFFEVSTD
jgi:hypothetical protein